MSDILILAKNFVFNFRHSNANTSIVKFAIFGVTFSTAILIFISSVIEGFFNEFMHSLSAATGHIVINGEPLEQLPSAEEIKRLDDDITGAVLQEYTSSALTYRMLIRPVYIVSMSDEVMASYAKLTNQSINRNGADLVISSELINNVYNTVPNYVNIMIRKQSSASRLMSKRFSINISNNISSHNMYLLFVNKDTLDKITAARTDKRMLVFIKNYFKTERIAQKIKRITKNGKVYMWQEINSDFFKALRMDIIVLFILIGSIAFLCCINVAGAIAIMIMTKKRDICILMLVGMSRVKIFLLFLTCGIFIASIGICIGLLLGMVLIYNFDNMQNLVDQLHILDMAHIKDTYNIKALTAIFNPHTALYIIMSILGVTFVALLYPSYSATKFNIQSTLRH